MILFAVPGARALFRELRSPDVQRRERSTAGLLIGWIALTFVAASLKPAQYQRYLMPALPALAIVAAVGVSRLFRRRIPAWLPGAVAIATVVAAFSSCLPIASDENTQRMLAMQDLVNHRLARESPLPVLVTDAGPPGDDAVPPRVRGSCRFFFGREPRPLTIDELAAASRQGRVTLLVPRRAFRGLDDRLRLTPLIETDVWVLAESG